MKTILTFLLLPTLLAAQPFAKESPCFNPDEISNLYTIVMKYEQYKELYPKRLKDIDSLNAIVIRGDERLNSYMVRDSLRYVELVKLYDVKEKAAVQVVMAKYNISETWIGRAWDWLRPRALFFLMGVAVGKGIDLYIDNN